MVVSTISFNYEILVGFLASLTFGFRTSLLDSVRHFYIFFIFRTFLGEINARTILILMTICSAKYQIS